jgi:hypothetical protein
LRFIISSVAVALVLCAAAVSAPAAQATVHGCPSYSVCIYPEDAGWNHDHPSLPPFAAAFPGSLDHVWYNLSGQFGTHKIFNNAYCMRVVLNTGYNGGGEHRFPLEYGHSADRDLTKINSITLWALSTGACGA